MESHTQNFHHMASLPSLPSLSASMERHAHEYHDVYAVHATIALGVESPFERTAGRV